MEKEKKKRLESGDFHNGRTEEDGAEDDHRAARTELKDRIVLFPSRSTFVLCVLDAHGVSCWPGHLVLPFAGFPCSCFHVYV